MRKKKGTKIKQIKKDVHQTKNVIHNHFIFTDIKHVNGLMTDSDRTRINGIIRMMKGYTYEEVKGMLPKNINFLGETEFRGKKYIQVLQNVNQKNIFIPESRNVGKAESKKVTLQHNTTTNEPDPVELLKEIWEKAYKEGYLEALSIIYKTSHVPEKWKRKALFYAAKTGDFLLMDMLLNLGVSIHTQDMQGNTALFKSAKHGKFKMMLYLLRGGAKLHHLNLSNENVLIQAVKNSRKSEIVRYLLDRGIDVNYTDQSGMNALMWAIFSFEAQKSSEWLNIVRVLIDAKINVNHKDHQGKTILMYVCSHYNENNSEELINLLLKKGADLDIKDNDGRTALSYARELNHSRIMYLLQENRSLTIPHLDVTESNMATASKSSFEKDSFLSRNGYRTTISNKERWRILNEKVFPNYSKQSTINFMATMIKRYKSQRGGSRKYENAIRTYEFDIARILNEK